MYSHLTAFSRAALNLLTTRGRIMHVVTASVADDTNIRLSATDDVTRQATSAVFAVMNLIQDVCIRFWDGSGCLFNVHSPCIALRRATAVIIHAAMISWMCLSAFGVGVHLQWPEGLKHDSLKSARMLIGTLTTDALAANVSIFKVERRQLALKREALRTARQAGEPPQQLVLLIFVFCGIHQVSLIRKPLALAFPGLWSAVVRLAHLFESRTWRQQFCLALRFVIHTKFKRVPVYQPPSETPFWRAKASRIFSTELSGPPVQFLLVDNGDLTGHLIIHWCLGQCCGSDEEAFEKCVRAFMQLFGKGFPVPLLYRWKHFEPAADYVLKGLLLHGGILREVLGVMITGELEQAFTGPSNERQEGRSSDDDGYVSADVQMNVKNQKRLRQVHATLSKKEFTAQLALLHSLSQPLDHAINVFLKRTRVLSQLKTCATTPTASTQRAELEQESRRLFLRVTSGKLGEETVAEYVELLRNGKSKLAAKIGVNLSGTLAVDVFMNAFKLALCSIADTWRRLVFLYLGLPWILFQLLGKSGQDFLDRWRTLKEGLTCDQCADMDFSSEIFNIDWLSDGISPASLEAALNDVAIHSRLSSDSVEVRNGQVQTLIHNRRRGRFRTHVTCAEESYLHSTISEHRVLEALINHESLPSRKQTANILRRANRPREAGQAETLAHKKSRLAQALRRPFRATSAWNVYIREELSGSRQLARQEWKDALFRLSRRWEAMSADDRKPYDFFAQAQSESRRQAMTQPLPSATQSQAAMKLGAARLAEVGPASHLTRKQRASMSYVRLQNNIHQQQQHPGWASGLGIQCSAGALRADLIDVTSEFDAIEDAMTKVTHGQHRGTTAPPCDHLDHIHDSPCHIAGNGICKHSEDYEKVNFLVTSFHRGLLGLRGDRRQKKKN